MKYFYLGFLSHLFYEDSPVLSIPSPPFSNFVHPLPTLPVLLWPCFFDWIGDLITSDVLFLMTDIMDLHMSRLGTFWCVLCNKVLVYQGLIHDVAFCKYSDLISHTKKRHTTHSGANRLTHPDKYILTSPVMCWQQLSVLHWMNNLLMSRIFFTETHNVFTFQKLLSCRSHISVL